MKKDLQFFSEQPNLEELKERLSELKGWIDKLENHTSNNDQKDETTPEQRARMLTSYRLEVIQLEALINELEEKKYPTNA